MGRIAAFVPEFAVKDLPSGQNTDDEEMQPTYSGYETRTTELKIYKTPIRPVVTYAAETWVLSKEDENTLRIFERKIITRICGPVIENNMWRIRSNSEINKILRGEDLVRYIKSLRLRWMGHVEGMENERIPKV